MVWWIAVGGVAVLSFAWFVWVIGSTLASLRRLATAQRGLSVRVSQATQTLDPALTAARGRAESLERPAARVQAGLARLSAKKGRHSIG